MSSFLTQERRAKLLEKCKGLAGDEDGIQAEEGGGEHDGEDDNPPAHNETLASNGRGEDDVVQ